MSDRDRALLQASGLNVQEVAVLFRRSRQAIYQGLSHPRDYFGADDARRLLDSALGNDSNRYELIKKTIEDSFPESEVGMILPDRIGLHQISQVIPESRQIIVVFNGNVSQLSPGAMFLRMLADVLNNRQSITSLIVPSEWVVKYLDQKSGLPNAAHNVFKEEVGHMTSLVLFSTKESGIRGFVLGRVTWEELPTDDPGTLWDHFAPMCPGYAENKEPEVA